MSKSHKYAAFCACGKRIEVETTAPRSKSAVFCANCRAELQFQPSDWDHTGDCPDSMSITSVFSKTNTICIQVFDMREVAATARLLDQIEPELRKVPPC